MMLESSTLDFPDSGAEAFISDEGLASMKVARSDFSEVNICVALPTNFLPLPRFLACNLD